MLMPQSVLAHRVVSFRETKLSIYVRFWSAPEALNARRVVEAKRPQDNTASP